MGSLHRRVGCMQRPGAQRNAPSESGGPSVLLGQGMEDPGSRAGPMASKARKEGNESRARAGVHYSSCLSFSQDLAELGFEPLSARHPNPLPDWQGSCCTASMGAFRLTTKYHGCRTDSHIHGCTRGAGRPHLSWVRACTVAVANCRSSPRQAELAKVAGALPVQRFVHLVSPSADRDPGQRWDFISSQPP